MTEVQEMPFHKVMPRQGSDVVRESFRLINDAVGNVLPVDGTGITIGVMSNSFDTQTVLTGNFKSYC